MKLKKILAAVAAAAVAVSTMAISAFAIDKGDYYDGGTLFLLADDDNAQWAVDNNVDITSIYGVKVYCTFDAGEIANDATWIGGGIGANSNSTGWKQVEWGRSDKEIIADLENGTVTWQSDAPIFQADEAYAQLWIQAWGGTVTFNSIEILDANGNVIEGNPAAEDEATEPEAEEAAPAEDETEAPEEDAVEVEDEDVEEDVAPVDEEPEEEAAPVEEEVAPVVEEAPAVEAETAAPATGNTAVAAVAAVMAVAGAAAIVSRKRK